MTKKKINPKSDYFCVISKDDLTLEVPPATINKLVFEMFSLESIVETFDSLLETKDRTNQNVKCRFLEENKLWK